MISGVYTWRHTYIHTTVEEHVANDSRSLVNFEWMTAQHDPLTHHPIRVHLVQRANSQQLMCIYTTHTVGEKQRENYIALHLGMRRMTQCCGFWLGKN